jgi:hypothetical protein
MKKEQWTNKQMNKNLINEWMNFFEQFSENNKKNIRSRFTFSHFYHDLKCTETICILFQMGNDTLINHYSKNSIKKIFLRRCQGCQIMSTNHDLNIWFTDDVIRVARWSLTYHVWRVHAPDMICQISYGNPDHDVSTLWHYRLGNLSFCEHFTLI